MVNIVVSHPVINNANVELVVVVVVVVSHVSNNQLKTGEKVSESMIKRV